MNRTDQYKYSVVDVAMKLYSHYTGSGDPIPEEKLKELTAWLSWRVSVGWQESKFINTGELKVEKHIRSLALNVLILIIEKYNLPKDMYYEAVKKQEEIEDNSANKHKALYATMALLKSLG